MTPEEQTFHSNWQKEFLNVQRTVLFGAIGHNPKTFKQYTPRNVTGLVQQYKQRRRILGVSSTYRTALKVLVAVASIPLAYVFNPLMYEYVLSYIAPDVLLTVKYYTKGSTGLFTWVGGVALLLSSAASVLFSNMPLIAATDGQSIDKQDVPGFYWAAQILCGPAALTAAFTGMMAFYGLAFGVICLVLSFIGPPILALFSYLFWPAVIVIGLAILTACN